MSDRTTESNRTAVARVQEGAVAVPSENLINVLGNSLYPGANPQSIALVLAWCQATGRDPMKKPIHIVPMYVKDAVTGRGAMRDVLMPGIGTYRTDAATTGEYAGKTEPEFGDDVDGIFTGGVKVTYPKWCRVTVKRAVGGQVREFVAKEFWLENYATAGRETDAPNAMWKKRPYGQLAKCAESQALRMAFPDETGNTNTAEEMEGKTFAGVTIDHTFPSNPAEAEPVRDPAMVKYAADTCALLDAIATEAARKKLLDTIADNLSVLRAEAPELAVKISTAAAVAQERLERADAKAPDAKKPEPVKSDAPKRPDAPKADAPKPAARQPDPKPEPVKETPPPAAPEFSHCLLDQYGDPLGDYIDNPRAFVAEFEAEMDRTAVPETLLEQNADALGDLGADQDLAARVQAALAGARARLTPKREEAAAPENAADPLFIPVPVTQRGGPHWPNYMAAITPVIAGLETEDDLSAWHDANRVTFDDVPATKSKVVGLLDDRLAALRGAALPTVGEGNAAPEATDAAPWAAYFKVRADDKDAAWAWQAAQDLAAAVDLPGLRALAGGAAVRAKMQRLKAERPELFAFVNRAGDERLAALQGPAA